MIEQYTTIWTPQPKQAVFLSRPEYEVLYGGAAGGGKSDALLIEALRQVHIPHYRALILRKTYPQLAELIDRSYALYAPAFPGARYNAGQHIWRFPSGAQIRFGSMQHIADRIAYQGHRFDLICFDELTHFTFEEYSYMFSRNRPSGPGTRVYMRAATNPGGVGHGWVKARFIDPAPPMTPMRERVEYRDAQGGVHEMVRDRVFVPASVFDNAALLDASPEYAANLALLPEAERMALLYGSWDSFSGQVFREWKNEPSHYADGRHTHVIDPFRVPKHWPRYRGFDFGYARPFSVGWYAVDEDGRIYRIAEYYGCTGTPNTGVKMEPHEIAAQIKRIEEEDDNLRGCKIIGIADPSIWDESRGESIAAMMAEPPSFVVWSPGDNKRIPGKMQMHYRLAFGDDDRPMLQVFSTCKHFIRTIPTLVYDERRVEDIDTTQEDHIYDECRYVLMACPMAAPKPKEPVVMQDDPLDLRPHRPRVTGW